VSLYRFALLWFVGTNLLAIVLTAPLGAFAMDLSYKKLLKKG
jgi:hypothetical protein